jgi:hypothetical protein
MPVETQCSGSYQVIKNRNPIKFYVVIESFRPSLNVSFALYTFQVQLTDNEKSAKQCVLGAFVCKLHYNAKSSVF